MKKTRSNKGFTLAELLIVIAIIAVLAGISIPVFGGIVEKANVAADEANLRGWSSSYTSAVMLDDTWDGSAITVTADILDTDQTVGTMTIPKVTLKSKKYDDAKKAGKLVWNTNKSIWEIVA